MTAAAALDQVDAVFAARRSVRGYRPDPVPRDTLAAIFAAAQRAPSWCNIQPWRVAITEPPVTGALAAALVTAAKTGFPHPDIPFPHDYPEPYLAHRRACGFALYGAMGIARDDKTSRYGAWLRNYELFDAPHLAVVSVDKRLGPYAFLDVGVWLGFLLAAATAAGVATCSMASIAAYPTPLRAALPIGPEQTILFGIALGYEDPAAPANACRTDRGPLDANVTFVA